MGLYPVPVARLIEEFEGLPGIGQKTAQRLAFYLLGQSKEQVDNFARVISNARASVRYCTICQNLADKDICDLCANKARDNTVICVVEDTRDVVAMERSREFRGLYHVLHGAVSPMNGIGPDDIRIRELLVRINDDIKEVIIATNPTIEGEATSMYILRLLKPFGVKVTRIAHGIPIGGTLEYADEVTLARAIEGRREL